MSSLKEKTITGLFWSFIDRLSAKGIAFIVGIILARLLTPAEFGLIGMITIFLTISSTLADSGFGNALIRKNDCTDVDYSTVFYFNIVVGLLLYGVLFFSAPAISRFFNEPQLINMVKVLSVVLILNSFNLIQSTILKKRVDFKLKTRISIISSATSGAISIGLAYTGFGVWALVFRAIIASVVTSFLLWLWSSWRPIPAFSKKSFNELFYFGSKLLLSWLIDVIYRNVYYLIIGKFFSAESLGFYTRADQFKSLPSTTLTKVVSGVSYPVLSQMNDDPALLKASYKKLISTTMFISFILMLGMAALAEPMIIILIGEKWRISVVYLQMLCFVGMMYPLHAFNLNMLQVKGRSDLFLKLEIIKKLIAIPIIVIGVFFGIKAMIAGMIVNTQIAFFINSYWSGKLINYSIKEQIMDFLPSFFIAAVMATIVFTFTSLLPFSYLIKLLTGILIGAFIIYSVSEVIKFEPYLYIKEILRNQVSKRAR